MDNSTRRRFLITAAGGVVGTAGCAELTQSDSDSSQPTGGESTQYTDRQASTPEEPSESLSLTKDGEHRWRLTNETDKELRTTAIRRVDGDGEADAKLINLLQPGGQREIYNNEDKAPDIMDGTDTYLDSTWFEGEYRNSSGEVDAEASVTGLEHTDVLSVYQYTIPNPTEIPTEDIKQIETTPVSGDLGNEPTPNPRSNKGDVLYDESFHPVWTQVHESELSGVSNSETFTWTLRPQPSVDLSIDSVQSGAGEIDDPEITVTARSATPVINSRIFIHTTGPNIEGNTTRQQFDPSNHLSENPNTLVTPEYGDERIGASRTIRMRFEHITDADFPLSDEDRIIVGVDSKLGSSAYPIAMSERSLPEVIQ